MKTAVQNTSSSFFPFRNKNAVCVALTFLFMGFLYGSWITRLPDMRSQLNLSEGEIGLALMGFAVGGLLITPVTVIFLRNLGTGRATFWATIIFSLVFTLPALAQSGTSLMILLAIVGMSLSLLNISMNSAATVLEKRDNINILSTCHGMFSVGLALGATSSGWISKIGFSFFLHILIAAGFLIIFAIIIRPFILSVPNGENRDEPFVFPPKAVIGLGIICACFNVGEGAVADWSAIYLQDVVGSGPFISGLGLAVFSTAMAIGRFGGDKIRTLFTSKTILVTGGLVMAAGLTVVTLFPIEYAVILGFLAAGLGLSSIVPVLYSESTKIPGVQPSLGLASVASFSTVGFLCGPPIIGFISEAFGLPVGFAFMTSLAIVGVALVVFRGI